MFFVPPGETRVRGGCPHLAKHRCPECPHTKKISNALRASMYQHTHTTCDKSREFCIFLGARRAAAALALDAPPVDPLEPLLLVLGLRERPPEVAILVVDGGGDVHNLSRHELR